jgi:tetratricopeptide (TPR) repeat protein
VTPPRMKRPHQAGPSIQISDQLMAKVLPLTAEHVAHFSSLESGFFKEGEDLSKGQPAEDVANEPTRICRSRSWPARRWSLLGAAIGIVCVTGLVLLGRWHRQPALHHVESVTPAAATLPTETPAVASVAAKNSVEFAAPAPVAEHQVPSPSQAATGVVATTKPEVEALAKCRKAIDQHRAKDVLANCPRVIDDSPQSVELAVILAKTEFERGRARQALDWAKKAVELDAAHAEAYVYLGGAEQAAGRSAAARVAYKRYLQLAPQGRHAADLRAVLANL